MPLLSSQIACISTKADVSPDADYLFSFDYQSPNTKEAGYHLQFNDKKKTVITERLDSSTSWQTFSKKIRTPVDATSVGITVYSYASDNKKNNIVRYDNFNLIEIPYFENRFYFVSNPEIEIKNPEKLILKTLIRQKNLFISKVPQSHFSLI